MKTIVPGARRLTIQLRVKKEDKWFYLIVCKLRFITIKQEEARKKGIIREWLDETGLIKKSKPAHDAAPLTSNTKIRVRK